MTERDREQLGIATVIAVIGFVLLMAMFGIGAW
jgi:hypothetical protein